MLLNASTAKRGPWYPAEIPPGRQSLPWPSAALKHLHSTTPACVHGGGDTSASVPRPPLFISQVRMTKSKAAVLSFQPEIR